jgi:hypothetical protein
MKKILISFFTVISISIFASMWPSGDFLETFQNGFLFGNGSVLSSLNNNITFNNKKLIDGELSTYHREDFDGAIGHEDFSCGNDSTFLGGGVINGATSTDSTTTALAGGRSFKYVSSAVSTNDYCASPPITLDNKQKDNHTYLTIHYDYDGDDDDISLVVYDVTNANDLTNGLIKLQSTTKTTPKSMTFHVPSTATTLRYGFQVTTGNSGAILLIDDIEFTTKPITQVTIQEDNEFSARISNNGTAAIVSQGGLNNNGQNAIASVSSTSTGYVEVTFTSGFFTEIPAVSVAIDTTGAHNRYIEPRDVSLTGFGVDTRASNGTLFDVDFSAKISRQADDYKSPNAAVVTSTNSYKQQSEYNTHAGYGSTNNDIPYYTNLESSEGSNIYTEDNDSTDGLSITMLRKAYVTVTMTTGGQSANGTSYAGVSKNSSQLTTPIDQINVADRKCAQVYSGAAGNAKISSCTWTGFVDAGDVLRPHGNNATTPDTAAKSSFSIVAHDFNAQILGAIPFNQYQTKIPVSDIGGSTGDKSDLSFSNLTIGKTYEITGYIQCATSGGAMGVLIRDEASGTGNILKKFDFDYLTQHLEGVSFKFTAATSNVFFNISSLTGSAVILADGTRSESFLQLTELNMTQETNRF